METIIFERIRDGRTDLVLELVQGGHAATTPDDQGVSLLAWCAYYGDVSALRFLEAHGAPLELLGENFDLNGAAFHGHWRLCQFLLERGANPNHPLAGTNEVPLHAALSRATTTQLTHVIELLLAHGADPNKRTTPGVETGAFMRDARTRAETPLHRAAAFSTAGVITRLLAAGADVEARDLHGDTPLAWASWHLRPAHVLDLLCYGPHQINATAAAASREPHDAAEVRGMERFLIGHPRL